MGLALRIFLLLCLHVETYVFPDWRPPSWISDFRSGRIVIRLLYCIYLNAHKIVNSWKVFTHNRSAGISTATQHVVHAMCTLLGIHTSEDSDALLIPR